MKTNIAKIKTGLNSFLRNPVKAGNQKTSLYFFFIICFWIPDFTQAQNLVQNPGFETVSNQPAANGFVTLGPNVTLANWGFAGVVDVHDFGHRGMGAAPSVLNHVDLNQNGSITQTISGLTTGATYNLSFLTSLHNIVGCFANPTNTITVQFGTMLNQNVANTTITLTNANQNTWTQNNYTFVATGTQAVLSFTGTGCDGFGGGMIDEVSLTRADNCDPECEDKDWFEIGTTRAPMVNTSHIYRIGNSGIGTNSPIWNFKLTVDNRDNTAAPNNNRNAIHATAMHTNCSFGYGILVNTNVLGGTKAIAVQGDGIDRALIFGNGMSWFQSRMIIGGNLSLDGLCDENPAGHKLIINGTGLVNGVNINSDMRFKHSIVKIDNTYDIIRRLNPVSYQYKTDEFKNRNFSSGMTYGFIAQELKEVLPYTVTLESDGYYSVNYIALIPVLTQAIKEQQARIDSLQTKLESFEGINKLQGSFELQGQTQPVEISKNALLFQNMPNPLNDITYIEYFLPENISSAFIKVIDSNGKLVQAFPLQKTGYGQLELNCGNLISGTYHYSLVVDNVIIDTRTMLVVKN